MVSHKSLTEDYRRLFEQVKRAVNEADLMGLLSMGAPDDEYELEVTYIVAGLKHCDSVATCMGLVEDVFSRCFGGSYQRSLEALRLLGTKLLEIRLQSQLHQ